ncbi:hypothetical protein V5799_000727 [Amblyomma americanum]|uniref:Uncharacterized protein n=1 Tax=Amblyomma americanum TaxID=6943 RepID=A0AAQ4D283_AMBAM
MRCCFHRTENKAFGFKKERFPKSERVLTCEAAPGVRRASPFSSGPATSAEAVRVVSPALEPLATELVPSAQVDACAQPLRDPARPRTRRPTEPEVSLWSLAPVHV